MSYSDGSVGACECGRPAIASCNRCGRALCDEHGRTLPSAPHGISVNALGRYELAIRLADGSRCEACRAEMGYHALAQATNAPRATLPDHWLDRALALSGDQTRSEAEKRHDADLPPSLMAADVAREFLRRIERQPQERVPISPRSIRRNPEYAEGWSVGCRRTEYNISGHGAGRYRLPCLISVNGELLGPALEDGKPGQTWWIVPESEIDVALMVTGVAQLLVLSAFMPPPGASIF